MATSRPSRRSSPSEPARPTGRRPAGKGTAPHEPATRAAEKAPAAGDVPGRPVAGYGLLVLAALVVIAAGLKTISGIAAPTFLVLTLVMTVQPLRTMLIRRGLPRPVASIAVLLSVYLLLVLVLGSAVWSITRLVNALPAYSDDFTNLFNSAVDQLATFGINTADIKKAASQFNLSSFAGLAQTVLNTVTSGLSLLGLLLAMVVFLTFDAAGIAERMALIRRWRPNIASALTEFSGSVRKYWVVTTVFGLIVAIVDVIALFIIGVPLAVTWGVLALVTNYIPNIGFLLGLVPPALIALLDGGVGSAVAVIASYCVINVVIQTLIQPRFTGDAVGIAPSVAFLSLIVWALILGPLGALLAVPATLLVKALLVDHSPSARWIGALLDSSPSEEPHDYRIVQPHASG